ncbi:MAG: MFS transporter [Bacteroidia bacterium]
MANKLAFKTFPGYGLGDFGFNLVFQFTQVYLSYFFAEIMGLSGTQAAMIFLLARIWDAINDPLMGVFISRTKTRWGTFRPFILWSILPLAGSLLLLHYHPHLEGNGAFIYALVAYILFGMAFTMGNVPYGALTARLTNDYHERGRLTSWRMTLGIIGGMVAVLIARPLTDALTAQTGDEALAWFITAGILGGIMAIALLLTFLLVKEDPNAPVKAESEESIIAGWKTLIGNKPFWVLTVSFVFNFIALTMLTGAIPFFFEFYLHDKGLEPIITGMVFLVAALSVPLWSLIGKRTSKRSAYIAGVLTYIAGLLGVYFLAHQGVATLYSSFILVGLGAGASAYAGWSMLPDTVEYGDWKNGTRNEGAVYGVYGFFFKLGIGLGLAAMNLGLQWQGYVQQAASQTESAQQGIRAIACIGPVIALAISLLIIWFYRLGPSSHAFIVSELGKRKGANSIIDEIGQE